VAKAVYEGRVDAGAGHDGVIKDLAKQPGYQDAEQVLVRLTWTDEIRSDPVVVNIANKTDKKKVIGSILAAAATPDGKRELEIFWGKVRGLAPTKPTDYDFLIRKMKDLRLSRDEDVLG
jgi:ABC-type phosphate/phosphonate transport system substrate-binding protein